ncbi:hypothetical protein YZ82_07460 [Campylobacter hyointestinalis]|uniref:Uncharacterized protein n=1 Tax=Campylobacter hyointestinalis TaxID=198 RepID=A0A562XA99_CAMHY|nr:hypothetical protein [Campylobacter hyointestinalis]TWO19069.1 hypothetical protein YZ82_07460 [Campylobacter hyointestinalis]
MKKLLFIPLFFSFFTNPLNAKIYATQDIIDGLCELYYEQSRADYGYSSARAMNKRIQEYRARFGLQEFDERECGNFNSFSRDFDERRAYNRGYEDGYYDSYDDRRYYRHPQRRAADPWNDKSRGGAHNPQNPWND